jgi:choline kinase
MRQSGLMQMVILAAGEGSRLRAECGGHPKQLLDVGGRTILARLLDLGRYLGAAALVVARPAHAAAFAAAGAEVLIEPEPRDLLASLWFARGRVTGDRFIWMAGDLLFADPAPLAELVSAQRASGAYGALAFCRGDRFKAKLAPGPPPRVTVTREGTHTHSLPAFAVQSSAAFADLAVAPRDGFLSRALARGERVELREYRPPVFEIDTPADLAAARRYFAAASCSTC